MDGDQDKEKQSANGDQDKVSKVDFDAKVQELEKMGKEMEDLRLEVFTPQYMEYLESRDKGKVKDEPAAKPVEEDLEKLSKKEILERAKELAKQEMRKEIDDAKKQVVNDVDSKRRSQEVAAFARSHTDFETYRPIMYGLSMDTKNKDLTLQELYDKAKEHVKTIHTEPTAEEKARQQRLASEKPGGDAQSFEKYQKMAPEQVAKESLDEVKAKLGPIPPS